MSDAIVVGIVTASWNGGERIDECIASVRVQGVNSYRMFIVDNASTADERARLRAAYGNDPRIDLIELPENRGYAGGNNVGIERSFEAGADYVLVLTQDAALRPGVLPYLIDAARAHPNAGVLGPLVRDRRTGAELSRGERIILPLLCVPRTLLRYRGRARRAYRVTGLMGCALLLTRRCVERIGAFDPLFFAYYEEVDLCLRARRHGFDIVCVPDAVVTHDGMRGFAGGFTPLSAQLKSRNLLYLMRRHGRWLDWLGFWPLYTALISGSMGRYATLGRLDIVRALARGASEGWRGISGPPTSLADAA